MKLVIDIDEEEYKAILHCAKNTPEYLTYCERMIADGTPLPEPKSPCDVCKYNPPSSGDDKSCTMCPTEREDKG